MEKINNKPLIKFSPRLTIRSADGSPMKSKPLTKNEEISDEVFLKFTKPDGEEIVFKSRPFRYKEKTIIAPFPNPIILLLNTSIECYNNSIEIIEYLITSSIKDDANLETYILEINENSLTNENYDKFMQNKIASIISLATALEAFLNLQIPNDFNYIREKDEARRKLNKRKIESSEVPFKEKLTKVMAQVLQNPDFEGKNSVLIEEIMDLYKVRREIIHLKTNGDDILALYFKSIGLISDIDLEIAIKNVIEYFNLVSPGYVVPKKEQSGNNRAIAKSQRLEK